MDTRYWGPSGWRLLHLVTFADPSPKLAEEFFHLIAFVLPCKYCRASFSQYLEEEAPKQPYSKWLWRVHNKVNAKLRSQNLPVCADPPFSAVAKIYKERLAAGCTRVQFDGWEFLFSIAENHPLSRSARHSAPMPDAPATAAGLTPLEKNRWNLLTPEERMPYYKKFWELLPRVLPFPEWQEAWSGAPQLNTESRDSTVKSLWHIRCHLEKELDQLNNTDFSSLCQELRSHRSGCGKHKRGGKTCRAKSGKTRKAH
jgi:Erv1 / Alr family